MAPLVVSVHSIVGLDFAGGLAPGWHSTQFPPFFVFGALLSGFAIVLAVAIAVRAAFRFEDLITARHLDILARLILASSLAIGLAYAMELFTPFYGGEAAERTLTIDRLTGEYAAVYWATIVCNVMVPQLLWSPRLRRRPWPLFAIALVVVCGMWCERYIIVVTSLHRDFLPAAWGSFHGTFWDWSTMIGTIGLFLTMLLLSVRVLPSFAMAELRGLAARRSSP
jgi:molybdopterin-containing oxidoreductase family membrane subunit